VGKFFPDKFKYKGMGDPVSKTGKVIG